MANYRNENTTWEISPSTQKSANWLSRYSKGRQYKFSTWQQVINSITLQSDKLQNSLKRHRDNNFLSTFKNDTIDVVYTIDEPAVVGVFSDSGNTIAKSKFSTYDEWWYSTVPTGIQSLKSYNANKIFDSVVPQKVMVINSLVDENAGYYVTLTSTVGSFIVNQDNHKQTRSSIVIHGYDVHGTKRNEAFTFDISDYQRSKIRWKYISDIETFINDDPSLFLFSFGTGIGSHLNYISDKDLTIEDADSNKRNVLWSWDATLKCLKHSEYAAKNISDFYAGIKDISEVGNYQLMSYNGTTFDPITSIDAILPSEQGNLIYILSNNELIAYSKLNEYPSIVKEASILDTPDSLLKLNIETSGTSIKMSAYMNREQLNKKIIGYRFKIKIGSSYYRQAINVSSSNATNNQWSAVDNLRWESYDGNGELGVYSPVVEHDTSSFYLDDVMVVLETKLQDGSIEVDTYVVEKQIKYPLFQYNITSGISLGYSADGFLAVGNGTSYREYKAKNDTYIIIDGKVVFAEDYKNLTHDALPVNPIVFNVTNELDQLGFLHSLTRPIGQKSYQFKKDLEYASQNKFNATSSGICKSVSTDIGLYVKNVAYYEMTAPVILRVINSEIMVSENNIATVSSLFNYSTLLDVLTYIGATSISITAVDTAYDTLPGRSILEFDNQEYYSGILAINKSKVILDLPKDEIVIDSNISVEGFDRIVSPTVFDDSKKQFMFGNNTITANYPLSALNPISYSTVKTKGFIKASPVIITSIYDLTETAFGYGTVSDFTKTILQDAENRHPNKWSA